MARVVACPKCKQQASIPDELLGKQVRCPGCGQAYQVAAPSPPPPGPSAPPPQPGAVRAGNAPQPTVPSAPPEPPPRASDRKSRRAPAAKPPSIERSSSSRTPYYVAGATGGVAALLAAGIVVWVLMSGNSDAELNGPVVLAKKEVEAKGGPVVVPPPQPRPVVFPPDEKQHPVNPPPVNPPPVFPPFVPPDVKRPAPLPPAPVLPADMPPVAVSIPAALAIKPPTFDGEQVVRETPDAIADVVVGAGGRFLFLHLPAIRKVAMFDVNEARIVHYFPVADDNVHMAAGATKLILVSGTANVIQRYDLVTREREVSSPSPFAGVVKAISLGSASEGPMLVYWATGTDALARAPIEFFDIRTMKALPVARGTGGRSAVYRDMLHFRASANSQAFSSWATSHTPSGIQSFAVSGASVTARYEHDSVGHVVPGPDGKFLYTARGVYTAEIKRVGAQDGIRWVLPAVHGDYYLSVSGAAPFLGREKQANSRFSVHLAGDTRPLLTLPDLGMTAGVDAWVGHSFTNDKRVHFIPDANVIVTIPATNRQIAIRRFNLDDALQKSDIDYLIATSRPPAKAEPGKPYAYQVAVKARKGVKAYRLESGPDGMVISGAGKVSWTPKDDQVGQHNVIVTISDAAGQEIFHTFAVVVDRERVAVADPKEPVRVVPKDWEDEPKAKPKPKPPAVAKGEPKASRPAPVVIAPPALEAEMVERPLPAAVGDLAVGGGGRYLLLNLPSLRKIALFDANEGKVTHYFPVAGDNVRFAAGMDKLVTYFPDTTIAQRWSLHTREKELTTQLDGKIEHALLGSASYGPLVVGSGDRFGGGSGPRQFDLATFQEIPSKAIPNTRRSEMRHNVRISGEGNVYGTWSTGLSPSGLVSAVRIGNAFQGYDEHTSVGHIVPSPDGKYLYTGNGVYTNEVKALFHNQHPQSKVTLPALHGDYYLSLMLGDRFRADNAQPSSFSVHLAGEAKSLVTIPFVFGVFDRFGTGSGPAFDKRFMLIPGAKMFVYLPPTNDKLILRKLDVEAELDKAGIDYLYVTSRPPFAQRGSDYSYTIAARSRKGGVEFRLESGPEGMAISKAGVVSWRVPNDAPNDANVIVTVKDQSGQEIFHTFKLQVE